MKHLKSLNDLGDTKIEQIKKYKQLLETEDSIIVDDNDDLSFIEQGWKKIKAEIEADYIENTLELHKRLIIIEDESSSDQ